MSARSGAGHAPCDRYPCDLAYRRQAHEVNEDGDAVHIVGLTGDGGLDGGWWDVAAVAIGAGPWQVAVRVGERGSGDLTIIPPSDVVEVGRLRSSQSERTAAALESAGRLAAQIVQAITWAASAEMRAQ